MQHFYQLIRVVQNRRTNYPESDFVDISFHYFLLSFGEELVYKYILARNVSDHFMCHDHLIAKEMASASWLH